MLMFSAIISKVYAWFVQSSLLHLCFLYFLVSLPVHSVCFPITESVHRSLEVSGIRIVCIHARFAIWI